MLNSTNYTPIKKPLSCSLLQELEAQEDLFPRSLFPKISYCSNRAIDRSNGEESRGLSLPGEAPIYG